MTAELSLLLLFLPIILSSAISDFRHLKIRNLQVLAGLGLFLLACPFLLDFDEISIRLLAAAVTFGICFVLFSFRLIGGGDAKMMPVVMLFVPGGEVVLYLRIFAFALLLVSLGALLAQRTSWTRRASGGSGVQELRQVPVGIAMASSVAALAVLMAWVP